MHRLGLVNDLFQNIHADHVDGDTDQEKSGGDPKCRQPESHVPEREFLLPSDYTRQIFRSARVAVLLPDYLASDRKI